MKEIVRNDPELMAAVGHHDGPPPWEGEDWFSQQNQTSAAPTSGSALEGEKQMVLPLSPETAGESKYRATLSPCDPDRQTGNPRRLRASPDRWSGEVRSAFKALRDAKRARAKFKYFTRVR